MNVHFVRSLTLAILVTSIAICDKLPLAPHIWDGNVGTAPPLTLYRSEYFKVPNTPPIDGVLWKIVESWEARPTGRPSIQVSRTRLESHQAAINYVSDGDEPNRYSVFNSRKNKWDATPVLGSHSLTHNSAYSGYDAIWFVQDKEMIGIEYRSLKPDPANQAAWHQNFLQIARAIRTKIVASGETGGDTTPPTLAVSATPTTLWPPNKKMVKITVNINAQDDSGIAPTVSLVGITSSAGGTSDISIGADGSISLKATRAGNESQRTYTITYKATDGSGNSTNASTTVIVPHDQGH